MDWISDHWEMIASIAGAIAYWLNSRKKEQTGEPADYDGDGRPDTPEPARRIDYDENMRRLQEEIRRKIAERQAGAGQPVPPLPRQQQPQPPSLPARPRVQAEARRAQAEREDAAVLERQRSLAEQLAALKAKRAEAESAAQSAIWTPGAEAATPAATVHDDAGWLRELRGARSLRKAVILREVLDRPVALR